MSSKVNNIRFFDSHNLLDNKPRTAPENYIKQELITYQSVGGGIKKITLERSFGTSKSIEGYSSEFLKNK